MAFDALCWFALFLVGWAVFSPLSLGENMRWVCDKIAEGWNSPPEGKI
jgi:hypothetical protein